MAAITHGILEFWNTLFANSSEVLEVTLRSLHVSVIATVLSVLLGVSVGAFVVFKGFPGRKLFIALVNTSMGIPPVVVGLFLSVLLWRSGPLGFLHIIYTPLAMIIAQVFIATPIATGITIAALQQVPEMLKLQLMGLGATRVQMAFIIIREAKIPLLAAVMAAFGAVISEVGASMMVGGNIKGSTRVLTTAIVMETGKGNFPFAVSLGVILLLMTFAVNLILTHIQQKHRLSQR